MMLRAASILALALHAGSVALGEAPRFAVSSIAVT